MASEEELRAAREFFDELIKNWDNVETLTVDANGTILLDRNNPSHVEWYEDD